MSAYRRLRRTRSAVPLFVFALALSGCSSSTSDKPGMTVDQAHSQLEALYDDTTAAFSPATQWADAEYRTSPDTTGLCGTSGCRKTGKAWMDGSRWAKTRIAEAKRSEVLDQVEARWRQHGYPVQRGKYDLEFRLPKEHAELSVDVTGCIAMTASMYDIQDDTRSDGTGGTTFGPPANGSSSTACATTDDPFWSH